MKKILTISAAVTAALISGSTLAAPKISAQSIIVNPVQSDLAVQVSVDRDNSGSQIANYQIGDNVRISATVNQDAYVYLFDIDAAGKITQILPNRFQSGANFLKANTTKVFPAAGDSYTFTIDGPVGLNKVLAVASKTELNLNNISQFQNNDSFATGKVEGQQQLAQALSIVVNPLPQNTWVSDTALYSVSGGQNTSTGSLFVGSSVPGSIVFLNGRQVGGANVTYTGLQPGSYNVRVSTPGYNEFNGTVSIRAGAVVNLNVDPVGNAVTPVQPVRPPSTANIQLRSSVAGALVFVDGRQVGSIQNGGLNLNLSRGSHEIVLIAPGYRTFVNVYNVNQGGTITINPTR
ncbi:DUF4384 domain-containing protein [Deinococcus sp. KNUC1210]|uniref:DUF4384 domain-containing protein n=1 Tax=Deinococcus sp. KNUC1210 TaxID=2917691 RepID=UPI001EF084D7|nr:DUF4384 domain-containing protein [Deinococcus sp. KNUC1210]ULH16640.1 DUF4384 domain-containing protein [Deinococcus sp. KNUC1210]